MKMESYIMELINTQLHCKQQCEISEIIRKRDFMPGSISEKQFRLLIELSPIYSEKVVSALRDYLVLGHSRKLVCEKHNVSNGYLSISLGRLFHINQVVSQLVIHYFNEK